MDSPLEPLEASGAPALENTATSEAARTLHWGSPDRAFVFVALAFALLAILPVWSTRFLPLLDDPNHLSAIYIWKELTSADSPLHAYYELRFAPVSYLLHYGLAYLFSFVLGVELAHKLVLSLYVLSFPVAAWLWCRATGRTVWLSLTTIPLAYSITWSYGFHSFNAGLAVCLFGVVAQDALLRRPSWQRASIATVVASACYFGHPLALVVLWCCTLALWAAHLPRGRALRQASAWRGLALAAASLVPSFLLYRWQSNAASVGPGGMRAMLGPDFPVLDARALGGRFADFAEHAVNPLAGNTDSRVFELMLAGTAVMFVVGVARGKVGRGLWLALAVLAIYLLLPDHFSEPVYLWIARGRVASLLAFFLLLCPPISDRMKARWLALGVALVGALVPVQTALAYREFDREMGAFARVLEACPTGEEILTIRIDGSDTPTKGFDQPVFRQLPSWVQVVHGGYNPSEFPRPIPFPFLMTKQLPQPHWRGHSEYMPLLQPHVFGCVLTMNLPTRLPPHLYALAREEGTWALYCAVDENGISRCAPRK